MDSFLIYNTYHRCAFLNNKTENNNGFKIMNFLIVLQTYQSRKRKNYNCKEVNYSIEIISKKRLEKSDNNLVMKKIRCKCIILAKKRTAKM